ncbi:hypothetical protein ASE00_01010 [Sphingomonas sp. Root710]|uniref:hypothetical protein n=1 Tax=Sphingomonas sp. Root710 TaxID=1736594 RepID=UPI0006F30209|nr:hypothetical protein [Sphingomonas sp. Root710]KRB85412.1 hypothetical protein ASE00_01010 [Sphingomonas sp. Root710]
MSFTQLNPPIPLSVLGKGKGYAIAVIDYGQEHNLIWVTALNDSGEIWCAPNPQVRMDGNWTMGRARPEGGKGDCAGGLGGAKIAAVSA